MRYTKRTETKIASMIVATEDMKKKISAFSNDSIYGVVGVVETVGILTFMFTLLSWAGVTTLRLFIAGSIYMKNRATRISAKMTPMIILTPESELSTGDVGVLMIVVMFFIR